MIKKKKVYPPSVPFLVTRRQVSGKVDTIEIKARNSGDARIRALRPMYVDTVLDIKLRPITATNPNPTTNQTTQ